MATVGNMASVQISMAKAMTNYSSVSGTSASAKKATTKSAAQEELDKMLKTKLKNYSSEYREQYTSLYKSIFGLTDESKEKADSTVSVKSAAMTAESSADALTSFAKGLKYSGEYDSEQYAALAEKFAESYNSLVDASAESDSQNVLQKGVIMVNTTKVYSSALKRAGFTVGSDNKLTFDRSRLSKVSAMEIKSTFGVSGYSDKIATKAEQMKNAAGSALPAATYNKQKLPSYSFDYGTLFSMFA